MYHVAGKFADKEKAGRAYTTLESLLRSLNIYVHITRLQQEKDFFVSIIDDGNKIDEQTKLIVQKILKENGGEVTQLRPDLLAAVQQRRAERVLQRGGGRYESHLPRRVEYRTPILQDSLTGEVVEKYPELTEITGETGVSPVIGSPVYAVDPKDIPPELRKKAAQAQEEVRRKRRLEARPFVIRYLELIKKAAEDNPGDLNLLLYQEAFKLASPYYLFTGSAMALFEEVWEPDKSDFPVPDGPQVIEIESPIDTLDGMIKFVFIYDLCAQEVIAQVQRKYPGLKDIDKIPRQQEGRVFIVEAIDEDMEMVVMESYYQEAGEWIYLKNRECPEKSEGCTPASPCETCRERTQFWASWARTALLMIDREYALTPEPEPWPAQVMTYEEEGMQKVGKGKNARMVSVTRKREVPYRVVSFDISTPAPKRSPQEKREEEEKRGNWLTLYGKDAIIYRRVPFQDLRRDYPAPHFRHLIERCQSHGGEFEEEGRKYTLSYRPDGTAIVTSTILPFKKYVPMLRERPPTIKKVIASAYEPKQKEEGEDGRSF